MYLKCEYGFADDYIDQAIELAPMNPKLYLLKGKITRSYKGNVMAMRFYRTAIELDSCLAEAYRELGICEMNVSMRHDAHENWQKASQLGDIKAKELIEKFPLR
jgi:tetratricopeptide (TPR) repeat protein